MKNKLPYLVLFFSLFQLFNQSVLSQSIFDALTLPRILNKNNDLIYVDKQRLKDYKKEENSTVPKEMEGTESTTNFINFDDVFTNGGAYTIAPNRYPGVSFYSFYPNSYTFLYGYGSSVSYPNKLIVGSISANGSVNPQSPLVVTFLQPSKDVSFYVYAGGCPYVNIDLYQREQFLRTVYVYLPYYNDYEYIAFNNFSQKITNLHIYYGCQSQYPYIAIDDFSFTPNPFDPPIGYIDGVNDEKGAYGWSVDPDNTSASNTIDCSIDNNNIGNFPANLASPDLQYPGNHRFEIPIPAQYRDGNQHQISCYGTDVVGGAPPTLLIGSPKTFTLGPAVQSVAFESVTNQVINNQLTNSEIDRPTSGFASQRIFPDKKVPDDTINHKTLRVKAVVGKPNVMVYFKNFDVDDPSDDPNIDDPTSDGIVTNSSNAGNDNREGRVIGQPYPATAAGVLSAASALSDANGEAVVYFTVTKQPGDNFVVAASTDETYLNGTKINGTGLKDSTNNPLPTMKAKRTELLTVWRKVHIEIDSMGEVKDNSVTGYIKGKGMYVGSQPKDIEIYPSTMLRVDAYTETVKNGTRLSYGGRMVVGGVNSLQVLENREIYPPYGSGSPPLIRHMIKVQSLNGDVYLRPNQPFKLYDDDDFNSSDGDQKKGDNGENVDYLFDTLSHMQIKDNIDENAYAAAYIMPEYDWAEQRGLNDRNVNFKLYVPCGTDPKYCENQRDFIENYRGSDALERDDFWIGYMFVAYQASESSSVDPQGFFGGFAPLRNENILPPQDDYNNLFGITPGGIGDIIFIETMRDYDVMPPPLMPGDEDFTLARTRVAPHELGHQFGLAHGTTLTGGGGLMSYTGSLYFVPHHINYMRWRIHSPGEPR